MNRIQVRFWLDVSDAKRLVPERIVVVLERCALSIAIVAAVGFFFGLLVRNTSYIAWNAALLGAAGAGITVFLWLCIEVGKWQSAPERGETHISRSRWLFVPVLAAISAVSVAIWLPLSWLFSVLATAFAYGRLRGRAGVTSGLGRFGMVTAIYLAFPLFALVANYPLAGAGAAMTLWIADAWRHRFLWRRH